ncbi:MAG: PD-(D/E)XK nuclease family protein, partial [Elusimicrobiota bacterium]|nr:PD-(D/E)XK nuclease family protein [Elusimicrobiota bacterium]
DNNLPLSTEYRSTVNIDGLSVISIVDRIDYLGEGRVSILDYKTGKTVTREPDQLVIYQKLMDNNPKLLEMIRRRDPAAKEAKISNMLFYYLPMLEEQYLQPAPKERIDDFWAGVLKVAADIMAAKFNPDPGESKCRFCDYRALCPVWAPSAKDEALATEAAQNAAPANPLEELAAKIDACGAALASAENLKREITAIMAKNNFTRHFGKNYAAELETINTLDFKDRQKTLELLKEFNLLPKVCSPTLSGIQKLLESGALDSRQKQAFDALARRQSEKRLKINKTEN